MTRKFHATVRFFDVVGDDVPGARQALEEKLASAGLGRWQIVSVAPEPPPLVVRPPRPGLSTAFPRASGPLLILGSVAYALWFFWLLLE